MTDQNILDQIGKDIQENPVILFMKGTSQFPQCGFSAIVVQILTDLGVPFKDIDILVNPVIRQGIKDYSNWPTIPQLYINSEFIGGCDIVREMYQSGELQTLLKEKGLIQG